MTSNDRRPVRRALLAVSDKEGLVALARGLADLEVALVSTGNTAAAIRDAGLPVTAVSEVTGFPEMLGGRVKTLHPAIHGGILADRRDAGHMEELAGHGIEPFDLVVVNLYPFERTLAAGAAPPEIVEQIDIGGPTLLRAAAKNFESVAVVVAPARYGSVLAELRDEGGLSRDTRLALAAEAFAHVAAYDAVIAAWFEELTDEAGSLPERLFLVLQREQDLRYGENPHQRAGLYRAAGSPGALAGARVLQGKEMSFNNWLDAEAAMALAGSLPAPAAVIVKHNNPCGAAVASTAAEAYRRALASDPVSAYGGVVAFNVAADAEAARAVTGVFTEVVAAPGFEPEARELFGKKANLRVLEARPEPGAGIEVRPLAGGGALMQDRDVVTEGRADWSVASSRQPTEDEWRDLEFAWTVAARVKSNAIVLAVGGATVGIGAGQMSRVDSVDIACRKAGARARGAVMASDAFFPFRDGVDRAAEAGVTAVIQPGGSVRDQEVLDAAEEHGMAMVLTGRRHFRH
ncbi:MAG: bifunctional phosphoribosylaminoimidazolecarboxamide formyltransferase/IMP cyclohydrolase [Actinomycetota bacterium]|nr:bifunctional phosphoribosylaminoimidazolecarboxamide formyltransferase/IMP cyclohydrolase [Actinomycetota bacterium]